MPDTPTPETPAELAAECKRLVRAYDNRGGSEGYNGAPLRNLYDAIDRLAAIADRATELLLENAHLEAERQLAVHKVITCGVAARHSDAALSWTGAYANEWDSPQAQEVRELRADRDRLATLAASSTAPAQDRESLADVTRQMLSELCEAREWHPKYRAKYLAVLAGIDTLAAAPAAAERKPMTQQQADDLVNRLVGAAVISASIGPDEHARAELLAARTAVFAALGITAAPAGSEGDAA